MGLSEIDKFKCELNKMSAYSKLSFPLYIEVTDTNVVQALSKVHLCFDKLVNEVNSYGVADVSLLVASPEKSLENARFINISREEAIKVKTRISIGLLVEADLSNLNGFWDKTKALGQIIDRLDSFCDTLGREKNHSAYLDRSGIVDSNTKTS